MAVGGRRFILMAPPAAPANTSSPVGLFCCLNHFDRVFYPMQILINVTLM
jgi:hypothetical protein